MNRRPPTSDVVGDGTPEGLVKIAIDIGGHWSGASAETMWALPTDDGLFELRNTPFYAYGLNWGDTVAATMRDDGFGGRFCYDNVVRRGGHRTVRIIFTTGDEPKRARVLAGLNQLNAFYEQARGSYYAIDVMPNAEYDRVSDALNEWQRDGLLDWELGSDGHGFD